MARRNMLAIVRELLRSKRAKLAKRLARNLKREPRRADQRIGCLTWQLRVNNYGYPTMNIWLAGRAVPVYVHILCWVLSNGRNVREDRELDHTCENERCCEPSHLEEVTHKVNCERRRGRIPWTYADAIKQVDNARAAH